MIYSHSIRNCFHLFTCGTKENAAIIEKCWKRCSSANLLIIMRIWNDPIKCERRALHVKRKCFQFASRRDDLLTVDNDDDVGSIILLLSYSQCSHSSLHRVVCFSLCNPAPAYLEGPSYCSMQFLKKPSSG